jgi:hypothetical protein
MPKILFNRVGISKVFFKMKRKNFIIALLPVSVIVFGLLIGSCTADYESDALAAEGIENEAVLKKAHVSQNQLLAQVRKATAKYHRLEVAADAGYGLDPHCVYVDGLGGMGHHAPNFGLVDEVFDPLMPEALLFEPGDDGKYHLVGVEYIVIDVGQDHPHFAGHPFDIGGTPVPDPHYSLHVWIWKDNPNGMFTPFNPNVSCGSH